MFCQRAIEKNPSHKRVKGLLSYSLIMHYLFWIKCVWCQMQTICYTQRATYIIETICVFSWFRLLRFISVEPTVSAKKFPICFYWNFLKSSPQSITVVPESNYMIAWWTTEMGNKFQHYYRHSWSPFHFV